MNSHSGFWITAIGLSLVAILAVGQAQAFCIYNKMAYDTVTVSKSSYKVAKTYKSCKKMYGKRAFEHRLTGNCYTCPKKYKRTVWSIKGKKACEKGGIAGIKAKHDRATYVGSLLRNNSFRATLKPGTRACCNWKTGGCNQTRKSTGMLEFSTDLVAKCTIPGKGPGSGPQNPAIQCPPLKFKIMAAGSARIYGRKSGSTSGSFRADLFDNKGRKTGTVVLDDGKDAIAVPPPGTTGRKRR